MEIPWGELMKTAALYGVLAAGGVWVLWGFIRYGLHYYRAAREYWQQYLRTRQDKP